MKASYFCHKFSTLYILASLELLTKKCGCVVKASLQELNKKSVVITCDAAENVSAEDIKKFQG